MISTLQTMQDTILILTFLFVRRTVVPIVTILSGLEHDTEIIFVQMSWKFITKSLLETGQERKAKKQQQQPQQKHQQTKSLTILCSVKKKANIFVMIFSK